MKKIISTLAIALACFSVWATPTQPQTVQFVWPWASGAGGVATMMRHLVNAANQQQDKYQFVFTQKLGAGGTIAANHVLSSNSLAVIANGDAMYTRPLMYNEAHDITQFQVVSSICSNMPLALYSRKYTSIDQLKNKDVTVGINPGTATQLLTSLIANSNPEFKFMAVPYKGLPESITDMLGGHIDSTVAFVGSGGSALSSPGVTVLGISGNRSLPGMPTFASQKVRGVEQLTNGFYIFAPRSLDATVAQEFNKIFNSAAESGAFKEVCTSERGMVEAVAFDQTEKLHQFSIQKWKRFTQGISKQ
jgi:tripartite-type tricarboxylate transporter receptor subunit TctC